MRLFLAKFLVVLRFWNRSDRAPRRQYGFQVLQTCARVAARDDCARLTLWISERLIFLSRPPEGSADVKTSFRQEIAVGPFFDFSYSF